MGKIVLKVGDDVSTDIIYPGRFMATVLPTETPQYTFADETEFNKKLNAGEIPQGSFIVAGENFGCGSSREQAASCLKGWELVIVAKHFARIFLQNAINLGLQMVICPDIEAEEGDELQIEGEVLKNLTSGKEFKIVPLPPARQAIIDAGGLVAYTRARLLAGK
ncbi:MAG: 3-isopropylmalate dehydratase [Candidatus Zixiibacteriota bacterium]|nr:MAG: 3-isopropylmalate dehydratase [candidate division Zixibacteria bacterium]